MLAEIRSSPERTEVAARAGIALGRAGEPKIRLPYAKRSRRPSPISGRPRRTSAGGERPLPLVEVARFAFASGRSARILQSAVPFESTESRLVSRELARRLGHAQAALTTKRRRWSAGSTARGRDPLARRRSESGHRARDRATASRERR